MSAHSTHSPKPINPSNAMETWFGIIRSLDDALRLVEAARTGILPRVTRRLTDDERANLIRSGSVFIFEETEAQVRRWADSRLWSSSRMKGHFLLYTQLAHDPAGSSPTSATPPSTRRPSDTSVSTTTSSPSMLDDKHVTPPPVAPGTIAMGGDSDDNDEDVYSAEGALPSSVPAAGSHHAAGASGAPTRTIFKKRALSLSTAFGQKLRLISYYTESDAAAGNLPTIDGDDRLANLPVPENLYYAANDTPVALSRRSATRMPTISGPVLAPQAASMPPSMVAGHGYYPAAPHDHPSQHLPHPQQQPHSVQQQHGQAQAFAQHHSQPQQHQRQLPAPIAVGTAAHHQHQQYHVQSPVPTGHHQEYYPQPQPQGPSPTNSYPPQHFQAHHHQPYPPTHSYSTSPPPPPGPPSSLLVTSPRRPSYSPTRSHSHPYARPPGASPELRQASSYPPVTASGSSSARHSWNHLDSPPPGILPHPSSAPRGTRSRSGSASSVIHPHFQSMSLIPSPTSASVPAGPARAYPPPTDGPLVLPPIRSLSPSLDSTSPAASAVPAGHGPPEGAHEAREGVARAHPDARYAGLATSEDKRQLRALDAWSSENKWRTF